MAASWSVASTCRRRGGGLGSIFAGGIFESFIREDVFGHVLFPRPLLASSTHSPSHFHDFFLLPPKLNWGCFRGAWLWGYLLEQTAYQHLWREITVHTCSQCCRWLPLNLFHVWSPEDVFGVASLPPCGFWRWSSCGHACVASALTCWVMSAPHPPL